MDAAGGYTHTHNTHMWVLGWCFIGANVWLIRYYRYHNCLILPSDATMDLMFLHTMTTASYNMKVCHQISWAIWQLTGGRLGSCPSGFHPANFYCSPFNHRGSEEERVHLVPDFLSPSSPPGQPGCYQTIAGGVASQSSSSMPHWQKPSNNGGRGQERGPTTPADLA